MTIALFVALALIYFGYMMYLGIQRQKLLNDFEKSIERAETLNTETQQRLQNVFQSIEQIEPEDLSRDYYFEKNILGRSRMFTAPVRYVQERQELVISAMDARGYEQEIALAGVTIYSGMAESLFAYQKDTNLLPIEKVTTNRRFPYDETESTKVAG